MGYLTKNIWLYKEKCVPLHHQTNKTTNIMENNKTTANYGFCDIQELFDYYGTGVIRIADFQLHSQGVLLTHICRNGQGDISFWSGNPEEDSCADEIIMSRAEWKLCCEQVLDMSC